jgi:hypothetical protein
METMGLMEITIKYFNVIVFIMCVLFGMISFFASWVAWNEIRKRKSLVRSVVAAYNIAEDAVEKGSAPSGNFCLDPALIQMSFNNLQEVLNAVYGEITGKPMPPREERLHGSRRLAAMIGLRKSAVRGAHTPEFDLVEAEATPIHEDREHHHTAFHP